MSEEDSDSLGGWGYECIWKSVVCFAVKEATEAPRSDLQSRPGSGAESRRGSEDPRSGCVLDCGVVFGDWLILGT